MAPVSAAIAPRADDAVQWNVMDCSRNPVDLDRTLSSGQAFRWRRTACGTWWGSHGDTAIALRQDGDAIRWQTAPEADSLALVRGLLRLDVDLPRITEEWCAACPAAEPAFRAAAGLRVLDQDPAECLFAFICATCNTVTKIERSVHRLAERLGSEIATGWHGAPSIHAFPSAEAIAAANERDLRADLWGYRAPTLLRVAAGVAERGSAWLEALRTAGAAEARDSLVQLPGIGVKLADCIALFCLRADDAVPIDTHTRRIACTLFRPDLAGRSLTPRVYDELASAYRERFGPYAGWAQQALFYADLRRAA